MLLIGGFAVIVAIWQPGMLAAWIRPVTQDDHAAVQLLIATERLACESEINRAWPSLLEGEMLVERAESLARKPAKPIRKEWAVASRRFETTTARQAASIVAKFKAQTNANPNEAKKHRELARDEVGEMFSREVGQLLRQTTMPD